MNQYHTVIDECNYESTENGINIILNGKVADNLPFKVSEYGESKIMDICKRWLHRKGYILKNEAVFLNELEDLCFDVLGDYANPKDIYLIGVLLSLGLLVQRNSSMMIGKTLLKVQNLRAYQFIAREVTYDLQN